MQSPDREQSEPMYGSELSEVRSEIARTIMRCAAKTAGGPAQDGNSADRAGRKISGGCDCGAEQSGKRRNGKSVCAAVTGR